MSYGRTVEPQILSIQAIIQKSEFKSKILSRIPTDIKKLFIEQATKPLKINQHKKPPLIYQGLYSQTIDHNDESYKYKKSIPPILSRQVKSQSLNSSTSNNTIKANVNKNQQLIKRNIHTTRTYANSRQSQRRRIAQRKSLEETASIEKLSQNPCNIENQNIFSNTIEAPASGQVKNQNQKQIVNQKFHTFEYELVLPNKDKKQRGFRKVYVSNQRNIDKSPNNDTNGNSNTIENEDTEPNFKTQEQQENDTLQHKMSHDVIPQPAKIEKQRQNSHKNSLLQKKTELNIIPDFVLAALGDEPKKISTTKSTNAPLPTFFQLNIEPTLQSKQRILKPPTCVAAMKKKISYNKNLRGEETYEEIMQPKVNFMKLVQKEKAISFTRKNSQVTTQNRKRVRSKERIPSFERLERVKHKNQINLEQDVKGWDINEGLQFYDQY